MKKSTLFKAGLLVTALFCQSEFADAQGYSNIAPKFPDYAGGTLDNWHKDYIGARFSVESPASLRGSKYYSVSNENTGTANDWGAIIDRAYENVSVVRMLDSLGAATPTNAADLVGKWALVFRGGGIEFGSKAKRAQDAGATGCIIVNNVSGGTIPMGPGAEGGSVTIPVIMITLEDGLAMNTELRAGTEVTVSLTNWSYGKTNDLGFVPEGLAKWHNYAIPGSQLLNSGNPIAYKGYTGAFIANYGTADQSDIKVKSVTTWYPDNSGEGTTINTDSVEFASFEALDSIRYVYSENTYNLSNSAQVGRYNVKYTISQAETDEKPADNTDEYDFYVTDSIFAKGRYDFAKGAVVANSASRSSGDPFSWGSLFYVTKAGHAAKNVQFTFNHSTNITSPDQLSQVVVSIFKWVDGSNGSTPDGFIQGDELTLLGTGGHNFNNEDSAYKTINCNDIITAENSPVLTEANTWYYVAVGFPTDFFIGTDATLNSFPRTYIANKIDPDVFEWNSLMVGSLVTDINSPDNAGITLQTMPFETRFYEMDSIRFSQQSGGFTPSIALHITKDQYNSVKETAKTGINFGLYPNPASDNLNIDLNLDKASDVVGITIIDALGKYVSGKKLANIKSAKETINTSNLANGNYYLVITYNADGTTKAATKQFSINRK